MVESGEREQRGKWNIANSMIGFLVVPSIFVWVSVEYGIHFAWLGCVVWLLVRALVRTFSCCNIVPCSSLTPCLCHQYLVWLPSSFSLLSCQPCGRWCMQLVFWFPVQFVHCTVGNPISEISGVHPVVGWFLWSLVVPLFPSSSSGVLTGWCFWSLLLDFLWSLQLDLLSSLPFPQELLWVVAVVQIGGSFQMGC